MATSATIMSTELVKQLSEIQQIFHEPLVTTQIDLSVSPDAKVQVAFKFKMENLTEVTHNISALTPKYKPTNEDYKRLNEMYLAVARAKDLHAWAPYDLTLLKRHIDPYLSKGTCEGQVLALAEATFDNPTLSADFLAKWLAQPNKRDQILMFHIMQALENSELSLLRGEKFELGFPYLFPSPCSPNGLVIGRAISHKPIDGYYNRSYGISCGIDYERHLLLFVAHFEKLFDKRNCLGLELATKSMFSKHILYLGKSNHNEFIAYDPDHNVFYQGSLGRVLNALFSKYKVNVQIIQFDIHEFEQNFPDVETKIKKPMKR